MREKVFDGLLVCCSSSLLEATAVVLLHVKTLQGLLGSATHNASCLRGKLHISEVFSFSTFHLPFTYLHCIAYCIIYEKAYSFSGNIIRNCVKPTFSIF